MKRLPCLVLGRIKAIFLTKDNFDVFVAMLL